MSSCLQTKTNMMKSINFNQFLNLLSALAELKEPKLFAKKPKKALSNLLADNFLKLLKEIEGHQGIKKYGLQAAFS